MTDKNNHEMEEISSKSAMKTTENMVKEQKDPVKKDPEKKDNGTFPQVQASNLGKSNKSTQQDKDKDKVKAAPKKGGDSFSPKEKMKSWYYARYQSVVVQRNILLLFALLFLLEERPERAILISFCLFVLKVDE